MRAPDRFAWEQCGPSVWDISAFQSSLTIWSYLEPTHTHSCTELLAPGSSTLHRYPWLSATSVLLPVFLVYAAQTVHRWAERLYQPPQIQGRTKVAGLVCFHNKASVTPPGLFLQPQ